VIGKFGTDQRNSRGNWLVRWCQVQKQAITNTFFKKRDGAYWTQISSTGRPRQIDYILVPVSLFNDVTNAEVLPHIGAKSDHRAVRNTFSIQKAPKRRCKQPNSKGCCWIDHDTTNFGAQLASHLADQATMTEISAEDFDGRVVRIEASIKSALSVCPLLRNARQEKAPNAADAELQDLVRQRKELRLSGTRF
jgi:hypothetical protein